MRHPFLGRIAAPLLAASVLLLAGCDTAAEVRESEQGPTWDDVFLATAPLLLDELGDLYDDTSDEPPEIRIDPGIAGMGGPIASAPAAEAGRREEVIRQAGYSVVSYEHESDCRAFFTLPPPPDMADYKVPPGCETVPHQGAAVVYTEPVREDGRWTVEAHVIRSDGPSMAAFDLATSNGEWKVADMRTQRLGYY